ncbi:MAG: menaquinone biosynthesis protein [Phycisphaerales bacterium]|nr:menaquinone biosynthesis protein [Phycisphaerales bacterium]
MISPQQRRLRIGAVSFLNTLPLIDGLEAHRDVELVLDVPSRLAARLVAGETDLSLCSVIDHQQVDAELSLVPIGVLGCDGPTDTVGLFSDRPIGELKQIACDTDSHTSVVLLKIIMQQMYGIEPELVSLEAGDGNAFPGALLLIGDKVINHSPPVQTHPHRLDLGSAWKELTGMPFVFGAWFRLDDGDQERFERARQLAILLDHRRRHNRGRVEAIIAREAEERGWPADHARHYLRELLRFSPTPDHIAAISEFHKRAAEVGAIPSLRPLHVTEFV